MGQRGWPPHVGQGQGPYDQAQSPYGHGYYGNYPYPYAGQGHAAIDPRYVGPRWAAPLPHRPLPKKSRGALFGCLVAILVVLVAMGMCFLSVVLFALGSPSFTTHTGDDGAEPVDPVVELPTLPEGTLPDSTPLHSKSDAITESAWTTGTCGDFSKERDRSEYVLARRHGSAGLLRGKVAVVHVRVGSPSLRWTRAGELNVDRAAILSQRYVLDGARRYGVTDIRYDVIPWTLSTGYVLPPLPVNGNSRLDDATMRLVREGARRSMESALGVPLERIVGDFRANGYQAVAFIVYFPVRTTARDFAFAAYHGDDSAEAAFVFSPTSALGHFAVSVAHEGLHLFGADDLYRVSPLAEDDKKDIMGEYCTGFREVVIGPATAYAIGWTSSPPPRGYTFREY